MRCQIKEVLKGKLEYKYRGNSWCVAITLCTYTNINHLCIISLLKRIFHFRRIITLFEFKMFSLLGNIQRNIAGLYEKEPTEEQKADSNETPNEKKQEDTNAEDKSLNFFTEAGVNTSLIAGNWIYMIYSANYPSNGLQFQVKFRFICENLIQLT